MTDNKKNKEEKSNKKNKTWLLFIIITLGLGVVLLLIHTFIPVAGRFCLINDFVDMLMFLDLGFLFLLNGFFLIQESKVRSIIIGAVLGLLGISCLWGAVDNTKFISDIGSTPQTIDLIDCKCDYKIKRLGKSSYKLTGANDGRVYTFDVGGLDKQMLTELGAKHGAATVTYYKNSKNVVSVEPLRTVPTGSQ